MTTYPLHAHRSRSEEENLHRRPRRPVEPDEWRQLGFRFLVFGQTRSVEDVVIRRLRPGDSMGELTELLHRSYARLLEMGLRFTATHQSEEVTRERCEGGECYVAEQDGRLIATITYKAADKAEGCGWYDRPDVAFFTQFAVDPDVQGGGLGFKLMRLVEERAREDGAAEIALDTSEKASHLIDYYIRAGYRFVEFTQWQGVNYRSVILSKRLGTD